MNVFKTYFLLICFFLTGVTPPAFAEKREIAITIDDLPFVGESKNFHLDMIINAIKSNEIPATGFIIAGEVGPANWQMLHKFREAGLGLGNHTLTHANLNSSNTEHYIQEIEAADKILASVLTEPKYFRYPYLATSSGTKKNKVMDYLAAKHYQIAPITIDSRDFIFNQLLLAVPQNERRGFLKVLKPCYLDFIWQQTLKAEEHSRSARKPDQTQILLIHANLLNAYVLPDIINLYKQHGFSFVSLTDALKPNEEDPRPVKKSHSNNEQTENYMAWD
ncbi:polysaccharide deacetylase family protein [Legionella fairfieldensis]|uniref:polysaccharide deacetylase family protein n=1 Tax=Legionella fairfieldensis TaxID=45064 RepID=UPI000A039E2F|nr:polysaccharide deacetylase family protein [Legionella fairfieldensis]